MKITYSKLNSIFTARQLGFKCQEIQIGGDMKTLVTVTTYENGRTYRSQWFGYELNETIDLFADWVECLGRWTA